MRLPITLLFVLATLSAFGQSRKGHFYLSGNTSLSAEHVSPEVEPNFSQLPGRIFGSQFAEDTEAAVTWRAQSSRIGYFLTNRLMLGTDLYVGTKNFDGWDESNYFLDPFVRYYVTDRPGKKVNFFAQLGFWTIGDYGAYFTETNFHLGVGGEVRLTDDVAASALLRYNAQAWGLNYTELELRLNAFIGGGLGKSTGPALVKGSILIDPSVGSIQLGHRGREETLHLIADLNVSGGYFLHDHWMVEAGFLVNTNQYTSVDGFESVFADEMGQLQVSAMIGARYFPFGASRFRPYILARSKFSQNKESITPSFNGSTGREVTDTQKALHLQAGAGTLFSLSNQVALDGEILYAAPVAGEAQREVRGRVGLKVFLLDQH